MRRICLTLACVILMVLVVSGCGGSRAGDTDAAQQAAVDQTPEEVIRDYFLAVGRHDEATQEALSSSRLREARRTWTDDGENAARFDMSNLAVSATTPCDAADLASRPESYQRYFAVRSGTVEYVMLDDSLTSDAGTQLRFVTVVKETESSPWRLEEIGTGP